MIKFKDVARFYIGCKLKTSEGIGTFDVYYTQGETAPDTARQIGCYDLVQSDWSWDEVKPMLRPLSTITSVEK